MGKNAKIEVVRTYENVKQEDLYRKPNTNTFFICFGERYMNQIKEHNILSDNSLGSRAFIKFTDRKIAELIGTRNIVIQCSSDAFYVTYHANRKISSGNNGRITTYMDSDILLYVDIPYKNLEEAREYLKTHNNTLKISFVKKEEEKEMDTNKTNQDVLNEIIEKMTASPTLSMSENKVWADGATVTYIITEINISADEFSVMDDNLKFVPLKDVEGYHRPIANPYIKFDDKTYKVFTKYLNDNNYKLLIKHNCGPTIDFGYQMIGLIGGNVFTINMMQFKNHPVDYKHFKEYLEDRNNKLELTFTFVKNNENEECV